MGRSTGEHAGTDTALNTLHKPERFMRVAVSSEREWILIIRGEFLEIPGLRLTKHQIQQLWGLRADVCTRVLERLLDERFLQLTADGHYIHRSFGGTRPHTPQVEAMNGQPAVYGH